MRVNNVLLAVLFVLALPFTSFAQEKEVSGTVKDEAGLPLAGVAVVVKGTTRGIDTDFDGKYTIKASKGETLVFSIVSYKTVEKKVEGKAVINVVMREQEEELAEVVVTGVGTATDKRKVAISVDAVDENSLKKAPVKGIESALSGKVAGAQIQSTSGQPGQQANIILRGINSIGGTQPMILVDGVQINASNLRLGSDGTSNVSSRLADLDLSNVERVEVIQGAAAATIYGAQGANGVIQIFTKKGKKGQRTEITVNSSVSVENVLTGNLSFAKNHYFKIDNDGYILGGNNKPITVDPKTGYWTLPNVTVTGNSINDKPYKEKTYDHLKQYYKTAYTQQHSLNVTGSSGNVDYALGFAYLNQESPVNGKYDKKNVTANLGVELFKGFTLRSNTQLVASHNTTGGVNGRSSIYSGIGTALGAYPFVDLLFKDTKGNYVKHYDSRSNNVLPFYTYQYKHPASDVNRVIENIVANYKINKYIELDYKYGVDHTRFDNTDFLENQTTSNTPTKGISPLTGELYVRKIQQTYQNSLASAFFRFDTEKDFGWKFPLQSTTQVSYDWRKQYAYEQVTRGTGFGIQPPFTLSTANSTSSTDETTEFVTFGYLVNQKFDFSNFFGFSVGVRSDYSSAFGEGGKPFTFPRGDAYLRLSELIKYEPLYELKLRGAYGEAGVQPDAYDRLITLKSDRLGIRGYYYRPSVSQNVDLGVEKSKELEIGLDYGLRRSGKDWFHRFNGSVVYWTRSTIGTIYKVEVAPSLGMSKFIDNAIDLSSNGLQASLDINLFNNDNFEWTFGTRFSTTKTLVDRTPSGKPIVVEKTVIKEGEPLGAFYGFKPLASITQVKSDGTRYISDADAANYEVVNGMVVDKTTKQVRFTSEKEKLGDATPDFTMSFFNDLTFYKDFTLGIQVDWVKGGDIYNNTRQKLYQTRTHGDFDNPVTINGQTAAFVNYYASMYNTDNVSSPFIEDGSYVRLRNVSLSYDLSRHLADTFVKGLTFTASARNLLTITDYSGMDPEAVGTSLNNPLYRGIDLYSFPNMRTYTFAVNLRF